MIILRRRSRIPYQVLLMACAMCLGCSAHEIAPFEGHCKTRAYIDEGVTDYLSTRFSRGQPARLAILPFNVPENFTQVPNRHQDFGYELARDLHAMLVGTGEFGIVEMLAVDGWPGKREDFFAGNHGAINLAHAADFDAVLVGYLDDITNASDLVLHTKVIDARTRVTIWSAETRVRSELRDRREFLGQFNKYSNWFRERPELFDFPQRVDALLRCVAQDITRGVAH